MRVAFQLMVAIGTLLALLGVVFVTVRVRRKRLPDSRWFYRAVVAAGPAAFVALIAGWVVTEVGRQPWVVDRVMRTSEAVTGASVIPVGYATLVIVYLGLLVAVAWILRRLAQAPLELPAPAPHGRRLRADRAPVRPPLDLCPDRARPHTVLGADFGAGMWQLTAGQGPQAARIRDHAHHSLAPVWEANHGG